MWESEVEVATRDGSMAAFFASSQQSRAFPIVIVYMDIWGIRDELRQIARNVAALGYCCALPDLFYRDGKVRHNFRDASGRIDVLARQRDVEPLAADQFAIADLA